MIVDIFIEIFNLNTLCLIRKVSLWLLILKEQEDMSILKVIRFRCQTLSIQAALLQAIIRSEGCLSQEKMIFNVLGIWLYYYMKWRFLGAV